MNNFELFKLKKAGLTNLNILAILDYQEKQEKSLSLRNMAVVSKRKNLILFMEKYKALDTKELRKEFNCFPSVSILDDEYPSELKHYYNPPVLPFYQGNLELLNRLEMAIVGARTASATRTKSVQKIVRELGNHFVIVSGLARGIDTNAHLSILKNSGASIVVIGCGLDVYYPKEDKQSQAYMAKNHLVLSEYVAEETPLKFYSPERNRIIAEYQV